MLRNQLKLIRRERGRELGHLQNMTFFDGIKSEFPRRTPCNLMFTPDLLTRIVFK